jgi:hypothetical protein
MLSEDQKSFQKNVHDLYLEKIENLLPILQRGWIRIRNCLGLLNPDPAADPDDLVADPEHSKSQ